VSIIDYFTINLRGTHEHFVNPTQQDYDPLDEGVSRRRLFYTRQQKSQGRPSLVLGARRVAKWPQAAIVLHREGFLRPALVIDRALLQRVLRCFCEAPASV